MPAASSSAAGPQSLRQSLHPYTWGLMASIPPLKGVRPDRLVSIGGLPPLPGSIPKAAALPRRCRFARPDCAARPPLRREGEQSALCVLDGEERQTSAARSSAFRRLHDGGYEQRAPLSARDLTKNFIVGKTMRPGSGRTLHAVDAISLDVYPGEDARSRRRIRQRQIHPGTLSHPALRRDPGELTFDGADIAKRMRAR